MRKSLRTRLGFVTAALTAALVWAPAALAQDPSQSVYGGVAGQGFGGGAGGELGAAGGGAGVLPFTGLDLALLVAGAAVLLVVGFGVRRLARDAG